jgi:phosphate starvation-inducible PhoH-like protein
LARKSIFLKEVDPLIILGKLDERRRDLEKKYNSTITLKENKIVLKGKVEDIEQLRKELLSVVGTRKEEIGIHTMKGIIKPRSKGQENYLTALKKYDVVVCIGPAGTGKTYLAVARAVELLKEKKVERVILTRPAVEAGEKLGFLPGDFKEKVDPYLRPLYDALYDLMSYDKIKYYTERRKLEVAPLAYMRGRNLDHSFIILDEAQNTSKTQMKMLLTRLGVGAKACITGDVTQVDLKNKEESGLIQIEKILNKIKGIKFVYLGEKDIIRHPLVKEIVKAYENNKG